MDNNLLNSTKSCLQGIYKSTRKSGIWLLWTVLPSNTTGSFQGTVALRSIYYLQETIKVCIIKHMIFYSNTWKGPVCVVVDTDDISCHPPLNIATCYVLESNPEWHSRNVSANQNRTVKITTPKVKSMLGGR